MYVVWSDCIQYQHTTANWCSPTPLSISHAGSSPGSSQVVPSVTGVGHCGFKSCTRDTSLTISRCFGGRTTADSYREDTVTTTFLVTIMQANANQHKLKGMPVCISTYTSTDTKPHIDACIRTIHTGMLVVNIIMHVHTIPTTFHKHNIE